MGVPTDSIADFLTRVRNASRARKERVTVPGSKLALHITEILKQEGFIDNFKWIGEKTRSSIRIHLKHQHGGESTIRSLVRVSKPGRRCYVDRTQIPRVLGGLGIAILSTSKGVMTDRKARSEGIGGELLCKVW